MNVPFKKKRVKLHIKKKKDFKKGEITKSKLHFQDRFQLFLQFYIQYVISSYLQKQHYHVCHCQLSIIKLIPLLLRCDFTWIGILKIQVKKSVSHGKFHLTSFFFFFFLRLKLLLHAMSFYNYISQFLLSYQVWKWKLPKQRKKKIKFKVQLKFGQYQT